MLRDHVRYLRSPKMKKRRPSLATEHLCSTKFPSGVSVGINASSVQRGIYAAAVELVNFTRRKNIVACSLEMRVLIFCISYAREKKKRTRIIEISIIVIIAIIAIITIHVVARDNDSTSHNTIDNLLSHSLL